MSCATSVPGYCSASSPLSPSALSRRVVALLRDSLPWALARRASSSSFSPGGGGGGHGDRPQGLPYRTVGGSPVPWATSAPLFGPLFLSFNVVVRFSGYECLTSLVEFVPDSLNFIRLVLFSPFS